MPTSRVPMKWMMIMVFVAAAVVPVMTSGSAAAETPQERVAAFHEALLDGDEEAVKGMLHPDLLLLEDGQAENSLQQYAGSHLQSDIAFSAQARRKLESQSVWMGEDVATVVSTYDLKTRFQGKRYHVKSAETMTLKKDHDRWVIVHVHWSNHIL